MVRAKYRIRFRKSGDLRLLGHHDLMRCFERMLRRAALPFRSTEGFNPRPRLGFPLSLALGIEGCHEAAELELDAELPPEEVRQRLAEQAPEGLEILTVQRLGPRTSALVRRIAYRVSLPPERTEELPARIAALLAEPHCWVERDRPRPRRFDLRPYVRDLRFVEGVLEIDLHVASDGMARLNEILAKLGLEDLLREGTLIQRTLVELADEGEPALISEPEA